MKRGRLWCNEHKPEAFIMHNYEPDQFITFSQAARIVPGGGVSIPTIWRWYAKGVCGVHLMTASAGRRLLTTPRWLEEFFMQSQEARLAHAEGREVSGAGCETSRYADAVA